MMPVTQVDGRDVSAYGLMSTCNPSDVRHALSCCCTFSRQPGMAQGSFTQMSDSMLLDDV